MKIEIDDAWAENELERQLRCLTPIDDLEEAEYKLNQLKSYKGDENLVSGIVLEIIKHILCT